MGAVPGQALPCRPAHRGERGRDVSGAAALTPAMAALVLFGVFFTLMILRVPVAFALGLACLPVMFIEPRLSPMILFNETFKSYNSFILLAVPFFLLTANLMNVGGITDRLVRLSRDLVGHLPGGLAQVNVVLSIFFAGISGSSTADAASQGKIFIEAQVKEGYDLSFSVAITAVSAILAVIIPPSILMIVWGGTLSVSIGALFLAGIIPGLLLGLVQMATVHVYAKLRNYPKYPRSSLKEVFIALGIAIPALMTPVIIIGGKVFGWFTATESAAIAVLYAGALSIFVYREMSGRQLNHALLDTGKLAAVALFCVGTASAFGWLLAYYQIPKALLAGVGGWGMGITATGFFIAFCFLVVGCFLDAIPAIIIVGTILEPLARAVGMDPVHFAMVGIISLAFGLVTPPYGLCLMISCAIAKVRLMYVIKDVMIMLTPMLGLLALTIVFPEIILFLPRLVSPEFLK
jgi:tripartite ATP-independent transporter DctM subunit